MCEYITTKQCQDYRKECNMECTEFRNKLKEENQKRDISVLLNTNFRLSFEKAMWIFFGAMVSGFIGVIIAILSR